MCFHCPACNASHLRASTPRCSGETFAIAAMWHCQKSSCSSIPNRTISNIAAAGGAVDREFRLYLGGFGPRDRSQRRENAREKPGERFSGPGDHSGPISDHFRQFKARPPICDLNIVILPQLRLLRLQHCDIGTVGISETSTM